MNRRILIANRGEIASRIARTCKKLGYTPVGIAPSITLNAPYLKDCDFTISVDCLNPAEPFLNIHTLTDFASHHNIQLLHPGYGFLSESPALSEACSKCNIIFIGPNPSSLQLYGRKESAKSIAAQKGIPVLPTIEIHQAQLSDHQSLSSIEASLTYPLMIKAVAGGGGRGMRILEKPSQNFASICESAAREAEKFFGDGTLLIEPYLPNIKHIEIQIARDITGDTRHFFERECSAQRSYQKILEETPSPLLASELREKLICDSIKLFEGSEYVGLGTVEFLITPEGKYFFTEVNPRLQVEHPITEELCGHDLVALQLHLAQSETLTTFLGDFGKVTSTNPPGHLYSVEVRVCAESSAESQPRTGHVLSINTDSLCKSIPTLRVESGIERGTEVSHYFDPLLLKLIVTDSSREKARKTLQEVLEQLRIIGVETNIPLLQKVITSRQFIDATYSTRYVDEVRKSFPQTLDYQKHLAIGAALLLNAPRRPSAQIYRSPWEQQDGFRLVRPIKIQTRVMIEGISIDISLYGDFISSSTLPYSLVAGQSDNSENGKLQIIAISDSTCCFELDGTRHSFSLEGHSTATPTTRIDSDRPELQLSEKFGSFWIRGERSISEVHVVPPSASQLEDSGNQNRIGSIVSPLPGQILEICIVEGQTISQNETAFILESMKMEHKILCSHPGSVDKIHVKLLQQVRAGEEIAVISDTGKSKTE
ncbi:MAG: ATP-grasp domain-containing protein [Bdellovibrionales bacterium]|nr:ATP-grasp domain-containing protein [Bdellovibrionales bacterium]